jgi:acyl-CoA thioester hydrolase
LWGAEGPSIDLPSDRVSATNTTIVRVRYAETDQLGVVYHSNYLVWLEVARTDLIRQYGVSYADLERDGFALAVAEATVRYLAPARYDDEVAVTATISEVRSRSLRFEYELVRVSDGTRLATAYTALVSIDPKTGRPTALPPRIKDLLNVPD